MTAQNRNKDNTKKSKTQIQMNRIARQLLVVCDVEEDTCEFCRPFDVYDCVILWGVMRILRWIFRVSVLYKKQRKKL